MPDSSKQEKEIRKEEELAEENVIEPEYEHLKTKSIPAIIVLLAALIAAIYTFYQRMPVKDSLVCILVTIIVFMMIGGIVKAILDKIEIPIPIPEPEEEPVQENQEEIDLKDEGMEKSDDI